MSLSNLGIAQNALGQLEAGLVTTQEAVALYRKLAEQHPDTFLPNLANSLFNLAIRYRGFNRHEDARPIAQEAFDTYWNLYQQYPRAFHDYVRRAAQLLCLLHQDLGTPLDPATAERIAKLEPLDP